VRRVAAGAGEPAVVLEAGLNNGAASWQRVMPLLAPRVRVAAYDRAGIGGSAPAPGSELPVPLRWGWRVMRAVFPDELHEDAPMTLAAMRELRAAATPFPDVPVVVLSAARGFPQRFRAHWTRLQAGLAAAAPQGRHVVVDGTGHDIPGNRPDVVAETILTVAAQARARGG
jgi:pimeloyl-ACP methyl ester carboxylesterase